MIRSACSIVDNRWAITIDVRSASTTSSPSWICASVSGSTDAVASSRITIAGSWISTRASATSCRCPIDSDRPYSPTSVCSPFGSDSIQSPLPTSFAAASTSASVASGFG